MAQPEDVEISSGDSGGAGPSQPMIALAIKGQDGEVLHFKVNIHKPIKKLLVSYCQKKLLDLKLLTFLINQRDFDHRKTPAELGLKDRELIVVVMTNYGG
ncbi:unnamed protein product [Linum trigynum]|uniref:Rad60/SUMO-like domain-containing protein n=1 Tax=Linum trigynum TaxID=586398 RepID=A0AAV2DI04_9ROSI